MIKLLREALAFLLTAMYINIRGESEILTVSTGKTFSCTYPHELGSFKFTSEEFKHTEKFKQWYLPNNTHYTYLVQVTEQRDGSAQLLQNVPMPMLCSKLFAKTTLPHRLAVSESLKKFIAK